MIKHTFSNIFLTVLFTTTLSTLLINHADGNVWEIFSTMVRNSFPALYCALLLRNGEQQ